MVEVHVVEIIERHSIYIPNKENTKARTYNPFPTPPSMANLTLYFHQAMCKTHNIFQLSTTKKTTWIKKWSVSLHKSKFNDQYYIMMTKFLTFLCELSQLLMNHNKM